MKIETSHSYLWTKDFSSHLNNLKGQARFDQKSTGQEGQLFSFSSEGGLLRESLENYVKFRPFTVEADDIKVLLWMKRLYTIVTFSGKHLLHEVCKAV